MSYYTYDSDIMDFVQSVCVGILARTSYDGNTFLYSCVRLVLIVWLRAGIPVCRPAGDRYNRVMKFTMVSSRAGLKITS